MNAADSRRIISSLFRAGQAQGIRVTLGAFRSRLRLAQAVIYAEGASTRADKGGVEAHRAIAP